MSAAAGFVVRSFLPGLGYAKRVAKFEREGMTTSDAQGCVDMQDDEARGKWLAVTATCEVAGGGVESTTVLEFVARCLGQGRDWWSVSRDIDRAARKAVKDIRNEGRAVVNVDGLIFILKPEGK